MINDIETKTADFYVRVDTRLRSPLHKALGIIQAGDGWEKNRITNPDEEGVSQAFVAAKSNIATIMSRLREAKIPCGFTPDSISLG